MDKKRIKKAAIESANSKIESFGRNGIPIGVNAIKEMIAQGFKQGAEWRINSVWHTKKEKPVCKGERKFCDIFYISKKGYPRANTYSESGFLLYRGEEWSDVKYWAYVEDLLPTRKEIDNEKE